VKGLKIMTDFVNGAIERVNKLIKLANFIPGVSIETMDKVTLFAGAKAEAEANRAEREKELQTAIKTADLNKSTREKNTKVRALKYDREKAEREKEIAKLQAQRQKGKKDEVKNSIPKFEIPSYSELPGIAKDIKEGKKAAKGTKKNTDKLKDGLEVKNEDISYLRDLMEKRAIQNFTFDKLEVIANNQFGDIHETADLDGWMEGLTDRLTEAVETTMGGVPQYE